MVTWLITLSCVGLVLSNELFLKRSVLPVKIKFATFKLEPLYIVSSHHYIWSGQPDIISSYVHITYIGMVIIRNNYERQLGLLCN